MSAVDLNADLGEGASTDEALLQVVTSANVACGGHAGDEETMRRAVRLALARDVGVGAHPSYPDREGFGRRVSAIGRQDLVASLLGQIRALRRIVEESGAALQHVKAHGALYNTAVADPDLTRAIGEAVRAVDATLIVVALAGSPMVTVLQGMGLRVAREAFVDRGYAAGGTLVARDHPGALLTDPEAAAARAVRMVREGLVATVDGGDLRVQPDTLCVHADTPGAPLIAAAARTALQGAGVRVQRLGEFL